MKALCVVPVDVPAAGPGEVFDMLRCVLFDGHPGAHSWALSDPDEEELRTRTGLLEPSEAVPVRTLPVGSCEHRRTEERYGVTRCHACGLRLRR